MNGVLATLKAQASILLVLVGLLWGLEVVDSVALGGALDGLGIRPRVAPQGLWGILAAPFLHAGFGHLLANTGPLVALGWLTMLRAIRDFFVVAVVGTLVSGLGVWLFGAPGTVHIGASGVVFAFIGYLLARGYFERSLAAIVLALVVAVTYGGALWGLLPVGGRGISWEGHLFGFLGGGVAARLLSRRRGAVPAAPGAWRRPAPARLTRR